MSVAIIVIVVVILAAAAALIVNERRRTRQLRDRFGGEYDRVVGEQGSRRQAEQQLVAREKRHEQLHIRPLPRQRVTAYSARWEATQTTFADEPQAAVVEADALVEAVMSERGYPTRDFTSRLDDLSVSHADVLQHYRAAHAIAVAVQRREVDTEQLRRAMLHYRTLFAALLDDTPQDRQQPEAGDETGDNENAEVNDDEPGDRQSPNRGRFNSHWGRTG